MWVLGSPKPQKNWNKLRYIFANWVVDCCCPIALTANSPFGCDLRASFVMEFHKLIVSMHFRIKWKRYTTHSSSYSVAQIANEYKSIRALGWLGRLVWNKKKQNCEFIFKLWNWNWHIAMSTTSEFVIFVTGQSSSVYSNAVHFHLANRGMWIELVSELFVFDWPFTERRRERADIPLSNWSRINQSWNT